MQKSVFINNSETDSDTSTPSEDFMSSFYPKPSTELKKNILKPVLPKPYFDLNKDIEVDDCFELSLLRFLHLIFGSNGVINYTNLEKYMDLTKKPCDDLNDFFLDNPGILNDPMYYYSDAGVNLRKKWVELLSERDFFEYKKSDYLINSTIKNFFNFMENFFPKLRVNRELSNNFLIEDIYSQLNFNWDSLELKYGEFQKVIGTSIHQSSIQNIVINKTPVFVWEMSIIKEVIEDNPVEVYSNSELRYN